jgi:hypothetical protein
LNIPITDKDGNILLELDENRFPITLPVKTVWGLKEYKINIFYLKDKNGVQTDNVKSINVNINKKEE